MGKRMRPPNRKRMKAICAVEKEKARYLMRISVQEKMKAERSINHKPLARKRFMRVIRRYPFNRIIE